MFQAVRYLAPLVLVLGFARCREQGPDITPATVALTPVGAATLASGTTLSLKATVSNAGGSTLTGHTVEWTSSDPAVASISPDGVVTGLRTGETQISAGVGLVRASAVTITVTPGVAAHLGIRTQPAGAASGLPLATQPVVEIRDAAGNIVTTSTATVTAIIATGAGTVSGSTATAVDGVATFTALAITGSVGDRTLTFSVTGLASVTSAGFAVGAGTAAKLVVRTEPTGAASGAPFTVQPSVEIRDESDNLVTTSTAPVTAVIRSGGGTLASATTNAVGGVATFSDLALTGVMGQRSLAFTSPGLRDATSANFTLIAGAPSQLRIKRQPAGAISAQTFLTQPIVEVTDGGGNLVVSNATVTASVADDGTGTLTGASVTAINGVATFTALMLTGTAGPRALTFSATGLASVTSASFTLASGLPTQLRIVVQPSGAATGSLLAVQPVIAVEDEAGNRVTNASGFVTAAIASGVGTITGANAAVVSGLATFQGMSIGGPLGAVTVSFRYSSLPVVISTGINVVPGPPARLVVRTPPPFFVRDGMPMSPQPVVEVQDAAGNRTSTPITITLTTDAISGTITNGSAVAINGIATFSGLTLAGPLGGRDYIFSAPGVAATNIFRITITP